MGLGLLTAIVLFVIPPLRVGMESEQPLRTVMEAERVAHSVLDFHTDTGTWPLTGDGQTNLALLMPAHTSARTRAMSPTIDSNTEDILMGAIVSSESSSTMVDTEKKNWLKEVPVDSWNRPFRVLILGERTGLDSGESSFGYPDEPPLGTAIAVISAGPNGRFETDSTCLWSADLSGRLARQGDIDTPRTDNSFGGDDLGFVLSRSALGEN